MPQHRKTPPMIDNNRDDEDAMPWQLVVGILLVLCFIAWLRLNGWV